jgi:hypothetical protein
MREEVHKEANHENNVEPELFHPLSMKAGIEAFFYYLQLY